MIHFGSFASDESIFYRDIEFRTTKTTTTNKEHNYHHKNVGVHHKIDEQLLKFLFAKYIEIYKKEYLMSRYLNDNVGVSSSSSSCANNNDSSSVINVNRKISRSCSRKCEIRTEYYNDFDVCLKEYYSRSHTNLSSKLDDDLKLKDVKKTGVDATVGGNNKKRKERKLLGKQDYKRRSSWNEISKRESVKPEYYKVYTFSDEKDTIASTYNKAKEDCDENDAATPTNETDVTFTDDGGAGIDTTIVTFDDIVEIFPRFEMTVTCPGVDSNTLSNFDSDSAWGNEREVTLVRQGKTSFGISIVGGKVNVGDSVVSGIFIKNVIDNSPADACGQLKIGDRILVVDGTDIRDSTHEAAVETIKKAGECLKLTVQSLNKGGNSNENGGFDFIKKGPPPVTPSKTPEMELIQPGLSTKGNLLSVNGDGDDVSIRSKTPQVETESEGSDSDSDEDTRDLEGRTHSKGGMEIDRASAANVKRSKDEADADPEEEDVFGYTMNKIKKRYGTLGQVLSYSINRGTNSSIGISLAGHRDRNKMACFVAGINPKGVAKQCDLEVGDEILEVNGIVLHGRCHLNASAIIKGLPGPVLKMIVLRRKAAVDDLAVKPVTQFPVEIDNEDIFASFKNVHTVTVKKGNQSLGIMIIEGKHAEVGQGIFISDIQEGSNAEKAGLNIGDMILAVNKDSLLGCNYETAASMLKKTEGLVTLTVCNPNKKGDEKTHADGAESKSNSIISTKSEGGKGPSRPITPKPQPSPAKEHHADPATAEIHANENATIEIVTDKKPLGVIVVGGNDTLVTTGAVIVDILPDSVAAKDNRLKPFDQILEINGQKITPDLNGEQVQRAVKQLQQKFRLIIHRSEPIETETLEIELFKKPGKYLGVGFTVGNPHGIVLSSILKDGIVETDGRLQKGDIVTHVNSESISNKPFDECSTILKTVQGRVVLKILRAKPNKRMLN